MTTERASRAMTTKTGSLFLPFLFLSVPLSVCQPSSRRQVTASKCNNSCWQFSDYTFQLLHPRTLLLPLMPVETSWCRTRASGAGEVGGKGLVQFSSVTQSFPTLCDSMDCSTPGPPVHHQLPEFIQTHVHWVGDAIQQFHPLLSPSLPPSIFPRIRVFSKGGVS